MSWIQTLADQLFTKRKPKLMITNKAREKMHGWLLTDKDVADVFYHGEEVKEHMIVRRYNGYSIGLYYFTDSTTGNYIVASVWKK